MRWLPDTAIHRPDLQQQAATPCATNDAWEDAALGRSGSEATSRPEVNEGGKRQPLSRRAAS